MNHQPYERWLLEPQRLSPEQQAALKDHLAFCHACQSLEHGWREVRLEILSSGMSSPREGFALRWKERAQSRQSRDERVEAWRFLLVSSAALLGLLTVLAGYFLLTTSLADILSGLAAAVDLVISSLVGFQQITKLWLQTTPVWLSITLMVSAALSVSLLILTWSMAIYRVFARGTMK